MPRVFAGFHRGAGVVAVGGAQAGDVGVRQIVVSGDTRSLEFRVEGRGMRDGVGADLKGRLKVIAVHSHQIITNLGRCRQRDLVAEIIELFLRRDRQRAADGTRDAYLKAIRIQRRIFGNQEDLNVVKANISIVAVTPEFQFGNSFIFQDRFTDAARIGQCAVIAFHHILIASKSN